MTATISYLAELGYSREVVTLLSKIPSIHLVKFTQTFAQSIRHGDGKIVFGLLKDKPPTLTSECLPSLYGDYLREILKHLYQEVLECDFPSNVPQSHIEKIMSITKYILYEWSVLPHISKKDLMPLLSLLTQFTLPELIIFELIVKKHGALSPIVLKMLEMHRFVVQIAKTGSTLYIMKEKNNGDIISIINEIPRQSALIWQHITEAAIPAAPIYKMSDKSRSVTRVFSRFCGVEVRESEKTLPQNVLKEISRQKIEILHQIQQLGISHGHDTHNGNWVIELIDKTYLKQQLQSGATINTIRYKEDSFSYDLEQYTDAVECPWQLVVRLIDFDRASKETPAQDKKDTPPLGA